MTISTHTHTPKHPKRAKIISHRQSVLHAKEAFNYFRRVRPRLYKDPTYRSKFVGIRDREIVDVDADKFALYERLVGQFPDHRFVVSQVLAEVPTIDDPRET